MQLDECRKKIDVIDDKIRKLLEERLDVSAEVAQFKAANDLPVYVPEREKEKLKALTADAGSRFDELALRELFSQIMAISRKKQYQVLEADNRITGSSFEEVESLFFDGMRICYQGAEGSYSEEASASFFEDHGSLFHVDTFKDAMAAIEEGLADYAVLPLENSTAGSIRENYDLLSRFENYIVGEKILNVRQCLMAKEGADIDGIRTVYSHPQSLMQCERFLGGHPGWRQVSMKNNAYAAAKVAADNDLSQAAIASARAAKLYGLHILQEEINHEKNNATRFIIVSGRKIFVKGAGKISIMLEIPHTSGSLYGILSHFIYNGLNMTRIESRPIEDRAFEYCFFIDFEGSLNDASVRNALRGLRDDARSMKVLGNY